MKRRLNLQKYVQINLLFYGIFVLFLGAAPSASGQSLEELQDKKTKELQNLTQSEESIKEITARQEKLRAEIRTLSEDREKLTLDLIKTANRAKTAEQQIDEVEARVGAQLAKEKVIEFRLERQKGKLSQLLGLLQRIGRRPPPAVIVSADDTLKMVRAAITLGSVLPNIRRDTDVLVKDLEELVAVRKKIEAERSELQAHQNKLQDEQMRLAALIDARNNNLEKSNSSLKAATKKAQELAKHTTTLKQLIGNLEKEIKIAAKIPELDDQSNGGRASLTMEEKLAALEDPGRLSPAFPFSQSKGLLSMPVHGVKTRGFGQEDEYGFTSKGMSLSTRGGAQVTSPSDGWVLYAGPFRSYGQMLILNVGEGYHIVLSGMNKVEVQVGQFVLSGEPVGLMGDKKLVSIEDTDLAQTQPVLYIELRRNGTPIDSAKWWAKSSKRYANNDA